MAQTLEQQRAADAWRCAKNCSASYTRLAKGLPALIMNSGLMQTVAFLEEKGRKERNGHHDKLGADLRCWLAKRFPRQISSPDFECFMQALLESEPRVFQQITAEAMAWLRWLRQIAPAVEKKEKEEA